MIKRFANKIRRKEKPKQEKEQNRIIAMGELKQPNKASKSSNISQNQAIESILALETD